MIIIEIWYKASRRGAICKPRDDRHKDLFRPSLDEIIALGHPLARLAREIDWDFLDGRFSSVCRDGDRANAILAAAGYNLSLLLGWFEAFFACLDQGTLQNLDSRSNRLNIRPRGICTDDYLYRDFPKMGGEAMHPFPDHHNAEGPNSGHRSPDLLRDLSYFSVSDAAVLECGP